MSFLTSLSSSLLIADGGMGTELKKSGVNASPLELANIAHPKLVKAIYQEYIDAGADLLTTNTFRGIALELEQLVETTQAAIRLAKECYPSYLGLSIGPIGQAKLSENEMSSYLEKYVRLAEIAEEEAVDVIILETFYQSEEVLAVSKLIRKATTLPLFVTLSIQKNGLTFAGEPYMPLLLKLEEFGVDGIGLNCLEMSAELVELAREIRQESDLPLLIQGNLGIPIEQGNHLTYPCTDQEFLDYSQELFKIENIVVGGCCGTTPKTISELSKLRFESERGEIG